MFERIRGWYHGEGKVENFDDDSDLGPWFYIEYHWTARVARALVDFYLRKWEWVWSTLLAIASIYVAVLALK